MTTCLDDNEIQALFSGRLQPSRTARLQAHVDGCSACRHLLAEIARGSGETEGVAVGTLPLPGAPPRTPPAAPPQTPVAERIVIRDGRVSRRPGATPGGTPPATPGMPPTPGTPATPPTPSSSPSSRRLAPGAVLADRYRLERIVGEGGIGIVWEATHVVMRRRVAIKILKATSEDAARRFFREARVTAALRHPHIVEVHDVFVVPETGVPAMVMEYLSGAPFSSWLHGPGGARALSMRETARVILPVVSALGAAHAVGVVHRDLKPENIYLVGAAPSLDTPYVKVLDFGLAKLTASEGDVASTGQITQSGLVLGTPHYMAPEQVAVPAVVDARTDVWSLGVVLYECLAGGRPIEGHNLAQIFRAIADAKIVPLTKRVPKLPRAVGKLVAKMLAKRPDERPTLAEIHETLVQEV